MKKLHVFVVLSAVAILGGFAGNHQNVFVVAGKQTHARLVGEPVPHAFQCAGTESAQRRERIREALRADVRLRIGPDRSAQQRVTEHNLRFVRERAPAVRIQGKDRHAFAVRIPHGGKALTGNLKLRAFGRSSATSTSGSASSTARRPSRAARCRCTPDTCPAAGRR